MPSLGVRSQCSEVSKDEYELKKKLKIDKIEAHSDSIKQWSGHNYDKNFMDNLIESFKDNFRYNFR